MSVENELKFSHSETVCSIRKMAIQQLCRLWLILQGLSLVVASPRSLGKSINARPSSGAIRRFPDGFKFGAATAAYQIEGAWNQSDKSLSIWDVFSNTPGHIQDNTTSNDACKSYEFYQRDIEMLNYLGVDFYRFSISWPRLFPNGFVNYVSEDGRRYYNNLINELLENGIEPMVTMYHWDLPQSLQDLGGWTNPLISDWFEDYARQLYILFGDRVKTWITINEPLQIGLLGYGDDIYAPGINAKGYGEYLAAKHIVVAHAKAWHVYNNEFREAQGGLCGITIATDFTQETTNDPVAIAAAELAMDFDVGLYSHPIFSSSGGFPQSVVERVAERSRQQGYSRSRLPEFTEQEKEFVRGTSDFYGFNHYSTFSITPYSQGMYEEPSYADDLGAIREFEDPEGIWDATVPVPRGIRNSLNWVKNNCNNPPIMITENGFGNRGGSNDDIVRINYYRDYLTNVLDAIEEDGCNVQHYTAWSLMDNFEWAFGLSVNYGIFEVNYEDESRTRTAKRSAMWYKNLLETRQLDPDFLPDFENISF